MKQSMILYGRKFFANESRWQIILLENISRLYGIHEFFLLDYIADVVTLLPGLDRVRHNHYH